MYKVEWEHGSAATLASLGQDGVIRQKKFASAHHLEVGQRLLVLTASGHQVTLTVRGIIKEEAVGLLSNLTISRALARTAFGQREDGVDFVAYAPGANGTQVRRQRRRAAALELPPDARRRRPRSTRRNRREDQQAPAARLCAVGAVGARLAVRDRQHAGALDLRANAGARDDARDRRLAPPDPPDDPLRVADHRPDRRRAGLVVGVVGGGPREHTRALGLGLSCSRSRWPRWSCC